MCCSVLLARSVSLARSISRVRTLCLCLSAVLTLGLPSCICLSFSSLVHDTPRCILFTQFIRKNLYGTICFLHGEEFSVPMWVDCLQKISVYVCACVGKAVCSKAESYLCEYLYSCLNMNAYNITFTGSYVCARVCARRAVSGRKYKLEIHSALYT